MHLDGSDLWGNKTREIRTLLYQRWQECHRLGVESLSSWTEIESHPDLETLRNLEKRLEQANEKKVPKRKVAV